MQKTAIALGIDLGTSGVRIAAIDQEGALKHTSAIKYPNGLEKAGDWQVCCKLLIRSLPVEIRQNLIALAIDGTSGTLLACDINGTPISDALPYHLNCLEQREKIIVDRKIIPIKQINGGYVRFDTEKTAIQKVKDLTNIDFPENFIIIDDQGNIRKK